MPFGCTPRIARFASNNMAQEPSYPFFLGWRRLFFQDRSPQIGNGLFGFHSPCAKISAFRAKGFGNTQDCHDNS